MLSVWLLKHLFCTLYYYSYIVSKQHFGDVSFSAVIPLVEWQEEHTGCVRKPDLVTRKGSLLGDLTEFGEVLEKKAS